MKSRNSNSIPSVSIRLLLIVASFSLFITSCQKDEVPTQNRTEEYEADFLYKYFDHLCKTIKTTSGFFPPQAARAYGYIGLAQYEAVVHGIPNGQSLQNQLNGFAGYPLPKPETGKTYNWALASNAATARIFKYMFEKRLSDANAKTLDSLENFNELALSQDEAIDVVNRSIEFGRNVADVVFEYSKTDGGHESYLDPFQLPYTFPNDSYCWAPTGAVMQPLSPQWGNNRPFLTRNITDTRVAAHVPFSDVPGSAFHKEAMVVFNTVTNNNAEQIEIAKYWADDPFATCTPAGHTFNILTQILKEERSSLAKASLGYAKMCIAENDAFIACWKGKYEFFLIRPVTYIKRYIDPAFTTVIGTPPFPAYTSGHSCEMGAGSRIFTDLFTDGSGDYIFTDYSQLQFGFTARSFSNFHEMAEECANSRLYGGIHFPMDNQKGLQVGRAVGDNVNKIIVWPQHVR